MSAVATPPASKSAPHVPDSSTALPFLIAPAMPHIREYGDENAEELARMWRESASAWPGGGPGGGEESTAALVRQEHRDRNTLATFLAFGTDPKTGEERITGFCSLFEYPAEANTAYVGTLSAHPDWHGTGVGRDLLKASLERTIALGYTRLDLNTWAGNMKAVPLYKKSGYFWVPETSVKMENYLPQIFRLKAAQAFFQQADWYRDLRRELIAKEDDEKLGKLEVYTYIWERDGRRLRAVIDRHSKGLIGLETDDFAISTSIDEPRLPIGGRRRVTWRAESRRGRDAGPPLNVTILAEGEDSVRCSFQASATVTANQEWSAPVTAEQPQTAPLPGRPANRIRTTAVVDGDPVPLALSTRLYQPVSVHFDRQRWLSPGVARPTWLTVENGLDEPVRGTLRLSASDGIALDRDTFEFDLSGRRRASWRVMTRAAAAGTYLVRGQATVSLGPADGGPVGTASDTQAAADGRLLDGQMTPAAEELRTKVFELTLHCGEPGAIFVDRSDDSISVSTDRLTLTAGLKPSGWGVRFSVADRESGRSILAHSCSLGPPFWPSIFTTSSWTPRIEQEDGGVTLVLSTAPPALPGVTFERIIRLSASGLIKVGYRVTNAGDAPRPLVVNASTSVDLDMASGGSLVAAPLATGLVIDESMRFPDWRDPEHTRPERYAETWMAEFGDGWVGATIWQGATAVEASWDSPDLSLDLGTVPPGATAQTLPLYLYAGQGDWKTARALWRQLVAPEASPELPLPRAAHTVALDRFVFDQDPESVRVGISSERARPLTGTVSAEVSRERVAEAAVAGARAGHSQTVDLAVPVPAEPGAAPVTLILDHQASTERYERTLIRAGTRNAPVAAGVETAGERRLVRVDNGRMRFAVDPAQLGRIVELSVPVDGGWQNQLHASEDGPGVFVWFNPWYGGVHASLYSGGGSHPGRLLKETFGWQEAARTGTQGIAWRGVTLSTETRVPEVAGLKVDLSYLTAGGSNLLAMVVRLENRSGARANGELWLDTFLQPGGDRRGVTLHYDRHGLRNQKRVHGGLWTSSERWCAVSPAGAGPTIAIVGATPNARVQPRDMGLEGVHPGILFRIALAPGEALEGVGYLVLAANLEQALLYRSLADVGGLA